MQTKQKAWISVPMFVVLATALVAPAAQAQPSEPRRASVSSSGDEGNSDSLDPSISNDGRWTAFESLASNLVDDDTNNDMDVFLYDAQNNQTLRISEATSGAQGNGPSDDAVVSGNGKYVAFETDATNLSVKLDKNRQPDIYVHDIQTSQTNRVSINSQGKQADGYSFDPDISDNGRYVAFFSEATNLSIKPDRNGSNDVFVYDREDRVTNRVSVDSHGNEAKGDSYQPSISGNGRYVAFTSRARNLVPKDRNSSADVFVYDTEKHSTTRVSVASSGQQGNDTSRSPAISSDGRYVAFVSTATNLVRDDTNAAEDVFVHDMKTGRTTVVSVASDGTLGNAGVVTEDQHPISISPNGAMVAFVSNASNLVAGDTNNAPDTFVRDRRSGETIRAGRQSINADVTNGFVVYDSNAPDEVMLDTNGAYDVFLVGMG
jgi:Tol biopolymer transport system component